MNGACPCDTPLETLGNYSCQDCGTACCRGCTVELSSALYCQWCAASLAGPAAS